MIELILFLMQQFISMLSLPSCVSTHEDGEGFNLLLQALPAGGKLMLRRYKEDQEEEKPKNRWGSPRARFFMKVAPRSLFY